MKLIWGFLCMFLGEKRDPRSCLHADLSLPPLFRYSILDKDCPISINPITGQLSTLRKLDRELEATHVFQVKAQEEPSGASRDHLLMLFLLNKGTTRY